jgi:adenylate kinase family enzyme
MTILLFGVSNVGKTITGELLAEKLNYPFFDLDEEVKHRQHISLEEFVSTGTLSERDQIRCDILCSLLKEKRDMVVAITPLSYMKSIQPYLSAPGILSIELLDSPQNIFDRLVFSDENDVIYKDDDYKYEHMEHYLSEISKDLNWYGYVYSAIENKFDIQGRSPASVVTSLISEFNLHSKEI